jgi:hypothetical protein
MVFRGLFSGLALCAVVIGTGCGGKSARSPAPRDAAVTVEVENQNWSDMVVYARRNTTRTRLGMVNTSQTASFTVPRAFTAGPGTLQLEADPVGSRDIYRSGEVMVSPGAVVEWTITASPALSRVSVR